MNPDHVSSPPIRFRKVHLRIAGTDRDAGARFARAFSEALNRQQFPAQNARIGALHLKAPANASPAELARIVADRLNHATQYPDTHA